MFDKWIPTHTQFLKSMLIGFIQLARLVQLTLRVNPIPEVHSIFFMLHRHIAMSFSLFVLLEQAKVALPLVSKLIPAHTQILKAPMTRFIYLALLVVTPLFGNPSPKLQPIFLMTLRYIDVTFSLLVLFKQCKIPLPLFDKRIPTHTEILKPLLV